MLKGASATGKTSLLQERCLFLQEKSGIPGSSILVLLADNIRLMSWNSNMLEKSSVSFKCRTFSSFVREEVTMFYPLALAHCGDIVQKEIKPVFLTQEASVHLISKVIQARREKEGLFGALVSSNERLAAVVSNNLKTVALEGIAPEEIGSRLYEALGRKEAEKERIFKDMDEIGLAYRKKCLELGVLDYGIAVEVYRKYILADESYRQNLRKRFKHLIIDDLQETSFAMLELAELLLESCDTAFLAFDPEFGSADLLRGSQGLLESRIVKNCDAVETENTGKPDFAEALYYAVLEKGGEAVKCGTKFERHPAVELRSEMLEQLAYRVCGLINGEGIKPADIVILSTYGDIVTELVIGSILRKNGIKLLNTGARQNTSDSLLCSGLLAFARLCHPAMRLFPEKMAVKQMVELLFGLDPVRSSKIARKTCSTFPFPELPDLEEIMAHDKAAEATKGKYDYVRNWINGYKRQEKQVNISMFLQLSLMEVFHDGSTAEDEVFKAKQMIDIAEKYSGAAAKFGRNTGRDFIEMAESILKSDESWEQPEETADSGCVCLTTPEAFIASSIDNKVLIISGLSSRHWSRSIGREFSNPRVLSASWDRGMIFTQEMEEACSRRYLASMLRAVFAKSGSRVIVFESLLSENGFENDGILPDILDKIL